MANPSPASLPPLPRRWRVAAWLATMLAGLLLALVVAHWGWRWFGPEPIRVEPAEPAEPAATIAAAGIFGAPTGAPPPAPAAAPSPTLAGETRLLGVFAEKDGRGYALFRIAGTGARLVAAGQEVAQGVTLTRVRPDGVTLSERGVERSIALRVDAPQRDKAAALAQSAARGSPGSCARPEGFGGQVVRLNAELLAGLIAQPDSWKAIVEPAGGGLNVRDDSGFVAMLGLRRGDRLEQANGIALVAIDDVVRAVLKPLTATPSQSVRLSGVRDGARRELLLLNAGACPA